MLSKIGKLINFRPSYGILEGPIFKFSPIGDCPRGGILPPRTQPPFLHKNLPAHPSAARKTDLILNETHCRYIRLYFGVWGVARGRMQEQFKNSSTLKMNQSYVLIVW